MDQAKAAEVVGVEDKNKTTIMENETASIETMNCTICHQEIFSEIGKSCRMCGMVLEDESKEFCSKKCRVKYMNINMNVTKMKVPA